jgi:hypothetical protein
MVKNIFMRWNVEFIFPFQEATALLYMLNIFSLALVWTILRRVQLITHY